MSDNGMKPMTRIFNSIGFALLIGSTFSCVSGSEEDPLAALLSSPPVISSVTPQIGSPTQNNFNAYYAATEVVIEGENFGLDTVVRFNEIEAVITANAVTQLYTKVPDGAYSGFITVSKSGGSCLPSSKTGVNCAGTEFFVDCYAPTNKQYGSEIELKQGESLSVEFSGSETKAFRTDTLLGATTFTLGCESTVTVKVFDRSCAATEYILVRDPSIIFPGGFATQFYVTAADATCSLVL
ncbi:hypothetical protein P3G55_01000 [Leptospira sp. 96542]|nr:hypothetical protein [Leptospira sp. 96542]